MSEHVKRPRRTTPASEALGAYVRQERGLSRLSLAQLAERVGVSPSYLSKLENGSVLQPSADILCRLADVLEIDSADLFAYTGYTLPESLPSLSAYLHAKYENVSDAAVTELDNYLQYVRDKYHIAERRDIAVGRRRKQQP